MALIAVLASQFASGARGDHPGGSMSAATTRPARFFLSTESGSDRMAVYSAATGKFVAPVPLPRADTAVYVAAAVGNGRTFLLADDTYSCGTTKLYRLTLTGQGKPGSLTPLAIPAIKGTVTALSASSDGSTVAYATQFCTKTSSSPGAIGVVHPGTGQAAQWSVPAPGQSITSLSITADGRMIAYAGAPNKVIGPGQGQILPVRTIRLLPADAPPGTAAQRSRAAVTISRLSPAGVFSSAAISADGRTLYFCTQSSTNQSAAGQERVNTLRSYGITTGTMSVLRTFGRGSITCELGGSGAYLLAGVGQGNGTLIKYDVATGRSVPVPTPAKWEDVTGTIPW
jgi:hypothetical protein